MLDSHSPYDDRPLPLHFFQVLLDNIIALVPILLDMHGNDAREGAMADIPLEETSGKGIASRDRWGRYLRQSNDKAGMRLLVHSSVQVHNIKFCHPI